jgi:CelD/BcsL family acetyltransferase involved in cellulose biosynthesis
MTAVENLRTRYGLARMVSDLKQHGPIPVVGDITLRGVNRLMFVKILRCMQVGAVSPQFLNSPPGYQGSFLEYDQLKPLIGREWELSESFLQQAFAKGDRCYGFVKGNELAAYQWYSTKPTQTDWQGTVAHFNSDYVYMYKGFTHPSHRGHGLYPVGVTTVLEQYLRQGYRGFLSIVEANNFASLQACHRMGYRDVGAIRMTALFDRCLVRVDSTCEPYGLRLIKRSLEESAAPKPGKYVPAALSEEHPQTARNMLQESQQPSPRQIAGIGTQMPQQVVARIERGGEELIHNLAPRWEKLCESVRSAPFCRPEWIAAYIRAFEPKSEVVLLTASTADQLVAVLPLVRKKVFYAGIPLTKLSGTANSHSVQFDIVRLPGAQGDAAIVAMWDLLRRTSGWQLLELPLFAMDGSCPALLTAAAGCGSPVLKLLSVNSPVLRIPPQQDGQPLQIGSRHFRHELRRYERILSEQTGTKPITRRCEQAEPALLEEFFRLEEAGWKGENGSAINSHPDTRVYYQAVAKQASERGYFCMHSMEANGRMVAGAFSVVTPEAFYPMKIAHDEKLRRGAPGHLLFQEIARECGERNIPQLFFGGTDEHYKSLWTRETIPLFSSFVFSSDLRALLAYRIRQHVLGPLGKLRWIVKQKIRESRANSSRRSNGSAPKPKSKDLVKVTHPAPAQQPEPKIKSSKKKETSPCA